MRIKVTRVDSKGRITIPFSLRKQLGLNYGDRFRIKTSRKDEVIVAPLSSEGAKIDLMLRDYEHLEDITKILGKKKINIVNSEIKAIGKKLRWSATLNYDGNIKDLKKKISSSN